MRLTSNSNTRSLSAMFFSVYLFKIQIHFSQANYRLSCRLDSKTNTRLGIKMKACLEKEFVKVDSEFFTVSACKIIKEVERNVYSRNKAKSEALRLISQFEEFLKSKGLEC